MKPERKSNICYVYLALFSTSIKCIISKLDEINEHLLLPINTCLYSMSVQSVFIKMLGLVLSSLMLVNLGFDPAIGCFFRPNCTGRIDEGVTFDDSYELTMEAFDFCDSDEDGCLTWKEIEPCEVRIFVIFFDSE